MSKNKKYGSVIEMVRDISDDPTFADELAEQIAKRKIVKNLTAMRCGLGLTQLDIARAIGSNVMRVSQIESGFDDDITLGELKGYLRALKLKRQMKG